MKFVLIVRTNHLNNSYSALKFAQTALQLEHELECIYFLFDGAYCANQQIDMPSDEYSLAKDWSDLAASYNLTLGVCAASSTRRGIAPNNFAPGFAPASLGQLVASCDLADRVVCL